MTATEEALIEDVLWKLKTLQKDLEGLEAELKRVKGYLCIDSERSVAMPKLKAIKQIVAAEFGVPAELVFESKSRSAEVVWPRQLAMYLGVRMTHFTRRQIADAFGKKDQSTVTHAIQQVEKRCDAELKTRVLVHRLSVRVQASINGEQDAPNQAPQQAA